MIQDRLLKQREVAEMIGMSESWLEMSRNKKTGIPFIKMERACRYRRSDVEAWLEQHMVRVA